MGQISVVARVLTLAGFMFVASACSVDLDAQGYTGHEEKRFEVSGTAELDLTTFDGAVQVDVWDQPTVQVTIERRAMTKEEAEKIEVKTEQNGNHITIEASQPPHRDTVMHIGRYISRSVRLVASVPRETNLTARSGDGSITVRGVSGRLELRSADGDINGTDLKGQLAAHTSDGSIDLGRVEGDLDVDTADGRITVAGKFGALRARTSDGSVTVTADAGTKMAADWDISTGDGSVEVNLPDGFNADLDAHTGDGTVDVSNLTLVVSGAIAKDSLRGKIGDGGRSVRIRSGDGSIRLRRG